MTHEGAAPPERQRVRVTGRVGSDPVFRQSAKTKQTIAHFPVGEHTAEGRTIWHRVVAFDTRAEALRDTLKKADLVEVIGYRHSRALMNRKGTRQTVEELYATAVVVR